MPGDRIELTVRLRRLAGTLQRAYSYPPHGHLEKRDSTAPWESFGRSCEFESLTGSEAVAELLDRGEAEELATHLTRARLVDAGHLLFALLFGDEVQWEPLLRGLFKVPSGRRPNPPRHPVRVRILSDDPLLSGLPWRVTAWQGKWLLDSGWTFEVVSREEAEGHVELPGPCKVLVIAPGCGEPIAIETHLEDLRETLLRISPHYTDKNFLTRVESRAQLADALRGMRPHIVYYYGHGTLDGDQACLQLGASGTTPNGATRRSSPS